MLYRSLGTSVRADRPLDTNSHSLSGDEASPGNRPETPTMAIGAAASPKVSPMPVSGTRVRNQPVVRSGWWWEWECEDGVRRTQVRAFFVCMKRCNFAAVFNAHNAMRTEITRGRTRIAKRERQRLAIVTKGCGRDGARAGGRIPRAMHVIRARASCSIEVPTPVSLPE